MIQNLPELANYVRKTLPYPKTILNLQLKEQFGGVVFIWQGAEFLVKLTFQVLEVRGNNLYITGLSTLLQAVLVRGGQEEQRFDSYVSTLNDVEDLIRTKSQPNRAAEKLRSVRESLFKMVGPR
jgi:hypothetical protein